MLDVDTVEWVKDTKQPNSTQPQSSPSSTWHELTPWQDTLASTSWFTSGSSVHLWLLPCSSCSQKGWHGGLMNYLHLVGGLEHVLCFHSVGNVFIPTDEVIFFRGVGQPSTRHSFFGGGSMDFHPLPNSQ